MEGLEAYAERSDEVEGLPAADGRDRRMSFQKWTRTFRAEETIVSQHIFRGWTISAYCRRTETTFVCLYFSELHGQTQAVDGSNKNCRSHEYTSIEL